MKNTHLMIKSLFFLFFLCMPSLLLAATSESVPATESVENKPAEVTQRQTPIAVEFEGNDSIGAALAMSIKERFNASNLFALSEKDEPKIRLIVTTVPEFPSRPGLGSAYSVVWLFSQSENTLRHFLQSDLGVMTLDQVQGLTAKLLETTDSLAIRYSYLFQ